MGVAEVDVKSVGDIRLSSPSSSVRATEDGQFSFFGSYRVALGLTTRTSCRRSRARSPC